MPPGEHLAWQLVPQQAFVAEGGDLVAVDKDLVERWLPRPHYVHLHRDDTVRQAVSYYRAGYSDRWFHLADEDSGLSEARFIRPLPMPEEPDWGHIRALENLVIAHEQCWSDFFTRSGIVPLEIRYEDMALSCDQTLRRVLDFIDVPLAPRSETKVTYRVRVRWC